MTATMGQLVAPLAPGLAWAGLAVMSVPILVHLLSRLRRRREPWAAMRFLEQAFRRQRTRMRLEQLLLLAARCAMLGVLGLALSGPALRGWGATADWARAGRLVCIVLDDSLSTQAVAAEGRRRFDRLKDAAVDIVARLGPADRVALWRGAWPADGQEVTAALDHAAVRRRLAGLEPRFTRFDLAATVASVKTLVDQERVPAERVLLVVLSAWSGPALDRQLGEAGLAGQGWHLAATQPADSVDNLQLVALRPRRHVLLAEPDGSALLALQLGVRRFATEESAASATVHLAAVNDEGRPLGEVATRTLLLAAAQTASDFGVELELAPREALPGGPGGTPLNVAAWLGPASAADALAADNQRWSVVELRRKLRVGVVDDGRSGEAANDADLSPARWLTVALAPEAAGIATAGRVVEGESMSVELLDPAAIGGPRLGELDAVLLLRPDRLDVSAWRALADMVVAGGLLWIFPPPGSEPAIWGRALRSPLGLDWLVGLEVRRFDGPSDSGWPLGAGAEGQRIPEALDILAADWPHLLRPVRVARRLDLAGPADSVWLATADGQALLLSAAVGGGRVMLLGSALDTGWTNLPTKPLFVPLVHESLHSAVAGSSPATRLAAVQCGERPDLGRHWRGAQSLQAASGQVGLREEEGRFVPAAPLEQPGIYRGEPAVGQRLAVNIDPEAADTRAVDAAVVRDWLERAGRWQWLDLEDAGSVLAEQAPLVALGWPLLWALLALVLTETAMARWFSHAAVGHRRSWKQRLESAVRG